MKTLNKKLETENKIELTEEQFEEAIHSLIQGELSVSDEKYLDDLQKLIDKDKMKDKYKIRYYQQNNRGGKVYYWELDTGKRK